MRPQKRQPSSAFFAISAALGLLVLTTVGRIPSDALWANELTNSAHGPVFALLTVLIAWLLRRMALVALGETAIVLLAALIAVALGAAVEVLQFALDRDASFEDLLHDALGALVAVGILLARRAAGSVTTRDHGLRLVWIAVALVAAGMLMRAPVRMFTAYLQRGTNFPTIVDFDDWASLYFIGTQGEVVIDRARPAEEWSHGERGMRVRPMNEHYWALVFREPHRDWRGYRFVELDIVNPTADPLVLRARIWDRGQARARYVGLRFEFSVEPASRRTVRIELRDPSAALDAPLDLARVGALRLARTQANRAREFYIMNVRLRN